MMPASRFTSRSLSQDSVPWIASTRAGHARSSCTRTLSFVFDQSCILHRGQRLLGGYGIEWAGWEVSKENLSNLGPFDSEANVVG